MTEQEEFEFRARFEREQTTPKEAPKAGPPQSGFGMGLGDPIHGGAQLLTKLLGPDITSAGNKLNNWIAERTGLVAKLPEGGVDQQVKEREAAYQASRGPDAGFDWARLGGSVLNPANLGAGGLFRGGASLAGRVGAGAGAGASAGALTPVTEGDDFASEKGKQVGIGAAFGGAVPAAVGGLGRVVSPKASTNPQLDLLRAEGVRPTVGQALGGMAGKIEEKATSLPLVGDSIAWARQRAAEDVNRAVAARALAPIGEKPAEGAIGRELVADTQKKLSNVYNDLLPKLTWRPDGQFAQQVFGLRQMVQTGAIKPEARDAFERVLSNEVIAKMGAQNAMTGRTFKDIEQNLGQQIGRLLRSTDADQQLLGDALMELRDAMRGALQRSNPQAKELPAINQGWANFKRLERAASYVGAEDGVFSPANLQSAVKATDRSKDKGQFARGTALMQDLSDASRSVLGPKVPDSGTAGRMMNAGALFSGFLEPTIPAALLGGSLLYSAPAQSLLRAAVSARPAAAQPIAGLLNQSAPVFAPAGGLLGLEMFQ